MAVDASTLPYEWYVDPGTFELERQRIFSSTWQYVGHVGRVGSTGDFFTAQLGELPIVITRDEDGQLHALRNVCCHRRGPQDPSVPLPRLELRAGRPPCRRSAIRAGAGLPQRGLRAPSAAARDVRAVHLRESRRRGPA